MANVSFNRNYNITRIVKKLVYTILALYVGGTIMVTFGDVMVNTSSPFYEGLTLVGWTVGNNIFTNGTAGQFIGCGGSTTIPTTTAVTNCVTATSGSGVLAVIGIIGLAGVVLEFLTFK